MDHKDQNTPQSKPYQAPKLEVWGNVSDLTRTGRTRPGDDQKGGSAASQGE